MEAPDKKSRFGIDAGVLKILAMLFMLCDHMWISVIVGNHWMTDVGRLAFPIFAFQTAEGYIHTKDFKKYALRLLIFALISEIPFNLFAYGDWFFPFHQNVLFTLLFGLLACRCADRVRHGTWSQKFLYSVLLLLCLAGGLVGFTDYGFFGVLTVLVFYVFRDFPFAWLFQLAAMIAIHGFALGGEHISLTLFGHGICFPVQGFAVFSLIFIWLYNGKPAKSRSFLAKWGPYLFYPVQMLILYFLALLLY